MSRWIAISTDALHASHRLHPHSTGEPACKAFAWFDLIGLAAWRDHGGLKRGQARASQRFLAARWNWSLGRVNRFLAKLEAEGSITRSRRATHGAARAAEREPDHITICNYDAYQTPRITNENTNSNTNSNTNENKEVPLHIPTSKRSRAKNGNGRKRPETTDPIDFTGAEANPARIREIMDTLLQ